MSDEARYSNIMLEEILRQVGIIAEGHGALHERLGRIEEDVSGLKEEVAMLAAGQQLLRDEVKRDINNLRDELKGDMKTLQEKLSAEIQIVGDKVDGHDARLKHLEATG